MLITRAAIHKSRVTFVALFVILVAGVGAYFRMPRAEDPGFIIRTALLATHFPGASPERVELLVTDELEEVIQQMPEIDFLESESKSGLSLIYVNIQERYRKMRPIWDNLRRKVEAASQNLPDDVIGPFVDDEFGDVFGVILAITGEGYSYAELKDVADQVRDLLLRIDDVAKVEIKGAQRERVFVEYSNARLAELGLSPLQLRSILQSRNIIIPGGSVSTGVERIALEPTGSFESIEDLSRTVITLPGRRDVVYLGDIAEIRRGYVDPPRSLMTSSGKRAVGLAVSMREGGSVVRLGQSVDQLINQIQFRYPVGVDFEIAYFQPRIVENKIRSFESNLVQAVAIVLGLMLLMLGLRTGLIVASLIPSAMIMSLLVMSFLGIGLDQMSIASLIIALGMLVDNAIVMSESIMVSIAAGMERVEAAIRSSSELAVPLLTSSLTTAAAFLPIYLAKSTTGEYTAPLFKVVTITLLCSWVLSLTVVPLLCAIGLRPKEESQVGQFDTRFYRVYRSILLLLVRHPFMVVLCVLVLMFVAIQGFGRVPKLFFPPSDTPAMTVELELPVGTAIEYTESTVADIDEFVKRELVAGDRRAEGVVNWVTFIGQGAPRFALTYRTTQPSPEFAFMLLNTTSRSVVESLAAELERYCEENHPGIKVRAEPLKLGAPIKNPVEIRVSGDDLETLTPLAEEIESRLAALTGTRDVGDNWGPRTKKLVVRINGPRARRAGVSNQDVAVSLQTILSGFETTDYREEAELIPITLRSADAERTDLGKIETLNIYSQATGQSVPLKQVADVDVVWQPARIYRRDRLKTVTVFADLLPGFTAQEVSKAIVPYLEEEAESWPLGFHYELGGEIETSVKANLAISEQLPIAGLIIVLLLIGQFNSIRKTLIILVTIPLALIGVVAGLLIWNSYFGFMTLLGIVSLAGIVVNNAIVLLDRIRIEIQENSLSEPLAVIEAAQRRLRPILLTTLTTAGGLIPLWLGGGPMWEPMAITIISGLLFSTVLTLGIVPVLYRLAMRVDFSRFNYPSE